jgi:hypothetical protein
MSTLPDFPVFAPLDVTHRAVVEGLIAERQPEVSELNFSEIFAWHGVRQTQITQLGDSVCMLVSRHGRSCFYPPLGGTDHPAVMRQLLTWLRERGQPNSDGFVYGLTEPEAKAAVESSGLVAMGDPDNADYVYRAVDLIRLAGHKYDGKRNHIRNFVRNYDFALEPIQLAELPEIREFQRRWCEARGCAHDPSLQAENRAVQELLQHFGELDVHGATLRIDGQIQGFTLASRLNQETALVIVEKANPEFRGIYQSLNQMFAEKMLSGYTWINREQDAGDEGLRRAKLSYHPHHMVSKYKVKLEGEAGSV